MCGSFNSQTIANEIASFQIYISAFNTGAANINPKSSCHKSPFRVGMNLEITLWQIP